MDKFVMKKLNQSVYAVPGDVIYQVDKPSYMDTYDVFPHVVYIVELDIDDGTKYTTNHYDTFTEKDFEGGWLFTTHRSALLKTSQLNKELKAKLEEADDTTGAE